MTKIHPEARELLRKHETLPTKDSEAFVLNEVLKSLSEALRQRDEARATVNWQPIETVIVGNDCLFAKIDNNGRIIEAHKGHLTTGNKWAVHGFPGRVLKPTHWMPLPQPPEQRSET